MRYLMFICLAAPALGHDFWIEPSTFSPKAGSVVNLSLRVGENFQGEKITRTPSRIVRFADWVGDSVTDVPGQDGLDPAGFLRVSQPGSHIVGYRSNHARVELEADKFEKYLKSEGLERIIELRKQRGESSKSAREVYSRAAKCLIRADATGDAGWERAVGFTLEILPEKSPAMLAPGDVLPVRIIFNGKPLEGVLISAFEKSEPAATRVDLRSDAEGRVRLPLSRRGVWLVKSTHMIAAGKELDADWESFWASLTFEIPAAKSARQ